MPRGARLDAPGTLHHVIIRGIERGKIVNDDEDRENFTTRIGELAQDTGTIIYAWALLTNHALCRALHKAWLGINAHA
jgi:REP element-mobilizing transposase RayT